MFDLVQISTKRRSNLLFSVNKIQNWNQYPNLRFSSSQYSNSSLCQFIVFQSYNFPVHSSSIFRFPVQFDNFAVPEFTGSSSVAAATRRGHSAIRVRKSLTVSQIIVPQLCRFPDYLITGHV